MVTVVVALPTRFVSLTSSSKTYVPGYENVTFVEAVRGPGSATPDVVGEAIATATGPLTMDHVALSFAPTGNPSSVALPESVVAIVGAVRVWLAPALTTGVRLTYAAVTERLAAA